MTRGTITRTVAIAESTIGCGATDLAVCLANYAASGLGETTAYLELNQRDEIKYWKEVNKEGYFLEKGVHYYPKIRKERIPLLMNQNYDRIIFNIGTCYVECREEILRCEQKIFLLVI